MLEHDTSRLFSAASHVTAGETAPLRILHLEDNGQDAELVGTVLKEDGLNCRLVLAKGRKQFENALEQEHFDLVLSDYALPDFDGLSALRLVREKSPHLPFILVSGTMGEERAVDSLKSGATDYVLKTRLLRLPAAVRRALSDAEMHLQYRRAEEEFRQSQDLFRQITENVEDLIAVLDLEGRRVFSSPSYGRLIGEPARASNTDSFQEIHPDDVDRIRKLFMDTVASGAGHRAEYRFVLEDGTVHFIESQGSVIRNSEGQVKNVLVVSRDISERKKAETSLAVAQKELVQLSRQAGMAEVATNVLHNVGNVLNSVNVSATLVADKVKKSRGANMRKVVTMLREHEHDLGVFLTQDPKGRQIPSFFAALADHLDGERADLTAEIVHLQKNVEHIKEIVAMQQSYATVSGATETVRVADLVEDALSMNAGSLNRHEIQIIRDFVEVPAIAVDKHKMLQILVNLMRNAKYACDDSGGTDKRITIRVTNGEGRVRISVADNGVGIPPENLTKIFQHGFTTRKTGHGFGLHSGALAAREMGGELKAHSEGPGKGAEFTLELPC